jgi:hypothetical protein
VTVGLVTAPRSGEERLARAERAFEHDEVARLEGARDRGAELPRVPARRERADDLARHP